MKAKDKLYAALTESLKLQSHYAELLNTYDGGKRMQFASVEEWLARLEELEARTQKTTTPDPDEPYHDAVTGPRG